MLVITPLKSFEALKGVLTSAQTPEMPPTITPKESSAELTEQPKFGPKTKGQARGAEYHMRLKKAKQAAANEAKQAQCAQELQQINQTLQNPLPTKPPPTPFKLAHVPYEIR